MVGYDMQQAQLGQMVRQNPGLPGPASGFATIAVFAGLGVSILWGWALPTFMLIWFSRGHIRDEIATWE